jgi:hypothetical protein
VTSGTHFASEVEVLIGRVLPEITRLGDVAIKKTTSPMPASWVLTQCSVPSPEFANRVIGDLKMVEA